MTFGRHHFTIGTGLLGSGKTYTDFKFYFRLASGSGYFFKSLALEIMSIEFLMDRENE